MNDDDDVSDVESSLREAGRAFLSEAWDRLKDARVVPRPAFQPYIEVGRDYFGDSVMSLLEYRQLEHEIEETHPRFSPDRQLGEREFPGGYIFSLLETFVARLTQLRADFSLDGQAAERSLDDLEQAIRADTFEVAGCRAVSYMTTADGKPLDFDDVRLEPMSVEAADHKGSANRIINSVIPGGAGAYNYDPPRTCPPPASVVITRAAGSKPFDLRDPLSGRIDRFLLSVRLLKPCTSESMYEVHGETRAVRNFKPIVSLFRGSGSGYPSPTQLAARAVTLEAGDVPRVAGVGRLLDAVQKPQSGMVFTSFGMAMQKYTLSYHAHAWYEQIVDLATAFEATLSGTAKEDVTLRLRQRAAWLLATDRDSAQDIFKDVGIIYGLRSTLVHGGALKASDLLRDAKKISTTPDDVPFGVAVAHVVERLRDLVRRGLLARICLASGDAPLWPLDNDKGVDIAAADDRSRARWREAWRDVLVTIDAGGAAECLKRQPTRTMYGGRKEEDEDS